MNVSNVKALKRLMSKALERKVIRFCADERIKKVIEVIDVSMGCSRSVQRRRSYVGLIEDFLQLHTEKPTGALP